MALPAASHSRDLTDEQWKQSVSVVIHGPLIVDDL
jgi:hypothetical protein